MHLLKISHDLTASEIYQCILGAIPIVISIIRFFRPHFLVDKQLLETLESRGTAKRYLLSRRVNSIAFGCVMILLALLPDGGKLPVCVPLFALVLLSILVCNKVFAGAVFPWSV